MSLIVPSIFKFLWKVIKTPFGAGTAVGAGTTLGAEALSQGAADTTTETLGFFGHVWRFKYFILGGVIVILALVLMRRR